jgi:hypothetical protein
MFNLWRRSVQIAFLFLFCLGAASAAQASVLASTPDQQSVPNLFEDPLITPTAILPLEPAAVRARYVQVNFTALENAALLLQLKSLAAENSHLRQLFEARERICDLGYLRQTYREPDGTLGYRCSGEPLEDFLRKGGTEAETLGRKCLCNGLVAAVDYGQLRHDGELEPAIVTAGDDASQVYRFVRPGRGCDSADDVIDPLLDLPVA